VKKHVNDNGVEYPVCDANGKPYDWFLDGFDEWHRKGCPEDGLGVALGKHMDKAARRGTLSKPVKDA
jgi:hypothetical protein